MSDANTNGCKLALGRYAGAMKSTVLAVLAGALLSAALGCATVPKNRRRYLADRTMPGKEDPLEKQARRKFHDSREAASGGDGKPAGGGCGCGN